MTKEKVDIVSDEGMDLLDEQIENYRLAMEWLVHSDVILHIPLKEKEDADKENQLEMLSERPLPVGAAEVVSSLMRGILTCVAVRDSENACSCCNGKIKELLVKINDEPAPSGATMLHLFIKDPSSKTGSVKPIDKTVH